MIKYCSNSRKYASSNPKKKFFDSTASIVSCKVTTRKYIKKAVILIRQLVTALTENSADVSWPPANFWGVRSWIKRCSLYFAEILLVFACKWIALRRMWKHKKLTKSFYSDAMFALPNGKFLTGKHCAVVLGFTQPDKAEATGSLLLKLRQSIR